MNKANEAFKSFVAAFMYNRNKDRKDFCKKEAIRLLKIHSANLKAIKSDGEFEQYGNLRDKFLYEYNNPTNIWPWLFVILSTFGFLSLMFYVRFYC